MKKFMDDDFLLESECAKWLYEDIASKMPVIDFHNHLSAKEIYENKNYESITEVWLGHDHYKWRAMRSNGIEEKYITGDATGKEKYMKWCETVPRLIGSPLYHWNHLEMKRYFNYDEPLTPKTADDFWDVANAKLKEDDFRPRELLSKMNVVELCTTDDPIDDLEYHKRLAEEEKRFKVRPTFRPDNALNIISPDYVSYIHELEEVVGGKIETYGELCEALYSRMDYFEKAGCRFSDHSLELFVYMPLYNVLDELNEETTYAMLNDTFRKRMQGEAINEIEAMTFRSTLLLSLATSYYHRGWTMQLHIGALRNNSARAFNEIGKDAGFDSMDDFSYAKELSGLLDDLHNGGLLPKTIIYNLNSKDTAMLATMIGNFQNEEARSKIQLGAAWWFLDHKRGIESQLQSFAESGVLANFVGMVTDSRSMLSFPRHEYFRRILCNYLGGLVENGEYPYDEEELRTIAEDICYNNIKRFMD